MLSSFLDAALPEPVINEGSILPVIIIAAVVVAAVILVRFEIKKKKRQDREKPDENSNGEDGR